MSTRTVRAELKINGVLTDATTAKLSDAAGTYGVKRNDTDAVVVADGTNMTHESTGVYTYTFSALADVAYTAWAEFVYGGNTYRKEYDFPAIADTGGTGSGTVDAGDATSIGFSELQGRVAKYLFGQRDLTPRSSDELDDINACIKDGLQSVYLAHRWSFMRALQNIVTVDDTDTYDLPVDFDTIESDFTFTGEDCYLSVKVVHESEIRKRRQESDDTGRPEYAAVVMGVFDADLGSLRRVTFYPTPDDAYTLTAMMRMRPTMIDANNPYPAGGEMLAPVIIEACLAAAESTFRDAEEVHAIKFQRMLAQAIQDDKDTASPNTLGPSACGVGGSDVCCRNPNVGVDVYFDDVLM